MYTLFALMAVFRANTIQVRISHSHKVGSKTGKSLRKDCKSVRNFCPESFILFLMPNLLFSVFDFWRLTIEIKVTWSSWRRDRPPSDKWISIAPIRRLKIPFEKISYFNNVQINDIFTRNTTQSDFFGSRNFKITGDTSLTSSEFWENRLKFWKFKNRKSPYPHVDRWKP